MKLKTGASVYFMGIGGTGMASVAGLAQEAGFKVSGSDANIYPPMSTMLEHLGIKVHTPYAADNLTKANPDMVIVGNAMSRGHVELEALLASKTIPFTSFPDFMGDNILADRAPVVVAGTHGKTTTTSLIASVMVQLGWNPGYLIGGVPRDLPQGFTIGKGKLFAVEGDEYDTAFFDKDSKFLHYRPKYVILNNIEFDHADIFADLAAIERQFSNLLSLVKDPRCIIANVDDPGVEKLLMQNGLRDKVTAVAAQGKNPQAHLRLLDLTAPRAAEQYWKVRMQLPNGQEITVQTQLAGPHNAANVCQVLACLWRIHEEKDAPEFAPLKISQAVQQFQGVKRRMDRLSNVNDVEVFEDFAHHPTAVKAVIESLRALYPDRRLIVAFEPKNATSRRSIFLQEFARSLSLADRIFIGACPVDQRIPADQRMDTGEMARLIGDRASAFTDNEDLLNSLVNTAKSHDAIVFMSSGSFSGIQYKIGERLAQTGATI